ncbi:MAG: Multi-sensor signal transduction histidine kinase [Parcubacteria group bacterium GW2011_GWB1_36_5]|nr:MAG: Multi-sensor signal transduction histidine kinase [Parcubacteria group bacterium GW2011_GWA2_36_24]KKQ07727.1 MAG: Multi-sensor signal transduction histidine kinase [Parcubacteria group bacterium GW2011_GWB1_36_5]
MGIFSAPSLIITIASVAVAIVFFVRNQRLSKDISEKAVKIVEREKEMDSKMYELAILKELGDRVGYSLDVHQIIDVITGSLHQFIGYSAVSYMLIEPEKVLFKVHLEKSVHRGFLDEIRDRMLKSLSALLDKEFKKEQVEELISGAILIETVQEPVRSFFNIPLVIAGKLVGILTVADTQMGLYKEDQMTILYKITNQASQAVTKLQEVVTTEQSKLNAMVESMADGIFMTDLDYRILVINPAARKAIKATEKKEVTIFDFIDNLGGKFDIRGRLEESVKLKKEYISDRILLGEKFFQIFVSPVLNTSILGQETVHGGVVIFHDVTSEVEVETLRKDFTSMLVHELRSPLDGIKKISEVLKNKKVVIDPKGHDEYIQLIYKNSSNMLELVNDILDVAKIESGKFIIKKQEGDIIKVINDRVDFYSIIAKDSNVSLKLSIANDTPKKVMFDQEGIEHVLNNLISNALKYTNEKGEVKVVTFLHKGGGILEEEARAAGYTSSNPFPTKITGDEKNFCLVVMVSDNGIGIEKENISNIFSKFRQLDTKNAVLKKKKGTGLGLVIAKGVVEEHNGHIGVESKIGVGSTFFFTLPLV